jgi:hypothetical protein
MRTPAAAAGFATGVWLVSDNLILPAFRLAAWPQAYPLRTHAYAWAAHLVYGAAVFASYQALTRAGARFTLAWLVRSMRQSWRRRHYLRATHRSARALGRWVPLRAVALAERAL